MGGGELWHSDGEWQRVAEHPGSEFKCVLDSGGVTYVGADPVALLRWDGGSLDAVDAFAEVEGHEDWFTPWGGPPAVRSLAATNDGVLFANVHVGGIVRSDGSGAWRPTLDISTDVHEVKVDHHRDLVVAACAIGFAESGDRGFAWSFDDEGLHATYARAIALCDDYVLMSVSRGPRGGDAAIYRQPIDGSETFLRCEAGLPESFDDNIDTGCLDARGREAVFGTGDGELFHSLDEGESWEKIADNLPPIRHVVLR